MRNRGEGLVWTEAGERALKELSAQPVPNPFEQRKLLEKATIGIYRVNNAIRTNQPKEVVQDLLDEVVQTLQDVPK